MNQRQLFLQHVAQTSPEPLALEITKAEGALLFTADGKPHIDLIGGISVANVGHRHPKVVAAIQKQLDAYMHIMVYGELVQTPQVQYATLLTQHLPDSLNSVYFTNSGAEAIEGAMKLSKRYTGRHKIIACNFSYHGSTQGALSLLGDEYWRSAYRPLLPGITHVNYNTQEAIDAIDNQTACIIIETIQAEGGVKPPTAKWLQDLRKKCNQTGALLVLDEVQAGFGRTGKLWGFENFDIVPDILVLGKALGGGMPLGAFVANKNIMDSFTANPVLGHITTFGGHPVCCAAGMAAMQALLDENMMAQVKEKEQLFVSLLQHIGIVAVHHYGLWLAVEFDSFATNKRVIDACIENGVFSDWFLFAANCLRISPPLVITNEQIKQACEVILAAI